ncbi:hypothetical protein Pla110_16660 [Polystyrenella longa]|uniref:Uncharacterized protein n=1 Tax=Polystyrenella longa TaxID=2528007 RepID=A0A518CL48_9PLAN|nr:hypothetical protein [Polystyrenella longa]QDU79946.1 hypothetical protein Pla110_16660 [Polystyrenella longa]
MEIYKIDDTITACINTPLTQADISKIENDGIHRIWIEPEKSDFRITKPLNLRHLEKLRVKGVKQPWAEIVEPTCFEDLPELCVYNSPHFLDSIERLGALPCLMWLDMMWLDIAYQSITDTVAR